MIKISKLKKIFNYFSFIIKRYAKFGDREYGLTFLKLNQFAIQAASHDYEPEILALYQRSLIPGGGYFIDVGANYGQTLTSLLRVDPNIPYIGIEPQPDCVAELNVFIKLNKLANHRIVCSCISNKESITELQYEYQGDVRASIIEGFRPAKLFPSSMLTVTLTGDKLVDQLTHEKIQFIKIDVEGAELEVLESFRNTILRDSPVISFEILPDVLVSTGKPLESQVLKIRREREERIKRFFESITYDCFLLREDKEVRVEIGPSPRGNVRNYVAKPHNNGT